MNVAIYIEDEKLDLFKDETIEITSSVQNVNDVTKNTLDYSKNFTVPASDRNNLIFKHWYNPDIDNGFDARTRTNGKIEVNGVVFKYGKFSLLGVKLKQGKPSSYSLVFYGNAISLADRLGNDELSSLDLSAYDHEYNDSNILLGLTNGLFSGDIKYTLMAKKRYYYNSSSTNDGVQSLNNHSNIANVGWANGVNWQELRASLRLIRIIEAIETKYGFTFSRDFFNRVEFLDLYLWLDNEKEKEISSEIEVDYTSIGQIQNLIDIGHVEFNLTGNYFRFLVNPNNIQGYQYTIRITPSAGYESVPYTLINKVGVNGTYVYYEKNLVGYAESLTDSRGQINQKNKFFIKSNSEFKFKAEIKIFYQVIYGTINRFSGQFSEQTIDVNYTIATQLPKLKIIDFLKGLFSMFKLVFYQEKESDPIYVNTLKDYYSEAVLYDISEFISTKETDVERGKLLNQISFKYEDPQSILNKQFKENTGLGYGDNDFQLEDDLGNPLEGEKEEIKVPFEQVVYERLTDQNNDSQTNVIVGSLVDDKFDAVNIKPHLHYVFYHNTSPNTWKFVYNNGSSTGITGLINTMAHTNDFSTNPAYSLVFDREFSNYTNIAIENTLYTNYYSDYITSVFNVKRRNFKFEAKLPLRIILKLKLKDVLKIHDNYYRINTWTYNLLTGICKLDLINSFDNTINGFNASRTIINTDYTAKIESIFVTNFENIIFDYDATWILDVYNVGNNIYFDIEENNTGFNRTATVTLINSDTLAEIEITINQTANIITFDNDLITFDNDLITWDNG